jgi:hypothetical protein
VSVKKSTTAVVKGELERYLLMLKALSQSVNYWMRLGLLPIDKIVRKSYLDTLVTECTEISYWSHCIHSIFSCFNMDQVWEYLGMMGGSAYTLPFKKSMQSLYASMWLYYINKNKNNDGPNKLRNYSTFKKDFAMENYVLSCNLMQRRHFTKLRISATQDQKPL